MRKSSLPPRLHAGGRHDSAVTQSVRFTPKLSLGLLLPTALLWGACAEPNFNSATPQRGVASVLPSQMPPLELVDVSLTSLCAAPSESSQDIAVPKGASTLSARLTGELCQAPKPAALTILFVLDYSGSMGRHVDAATNQSHAGQDPWRTGADGTASCGRLDAARAVVARAKQQLAAMPAEQAAEVAVGLIGFASDPLRQMEVAPTALSQLEAQLTPDVFCRYVVQRSSDLGASNPSGILPAGVDASTNYAAAFARASTVLADRPGQKLVYFISDGEPTSGGGNPIAAGVAAAKALRQLPDLSLNGLLLGEAGTRAEQVLRDAVGDPERVRVVSRAGELAQAVLDMPAAAATPPKVTLTVTSAEGTAVEVKLAWLEASKQAAGTFGFASEEFTLQAGTESSLRLTASFAQGGESQQRLLHLRVSEE